MADTDRKDEDSKDERTAPPAPGGVRRAASPSWHSPAKVGIALLLWVLYPLAFPRLFATAGHSAGVLAVPAVLIVAWFWGLRPGVTAALATGLALNPLLASLSGATEAWYVAVTTGMPGMAATVLTAAVVGRFRDLSVRLKHELAERARAEHALREQKEQYQLLVEQADDIIYRADVDGHFTYVSPASTRILGYRPEELLGRHFLALVAPDASAAAHRFYLRQFARRIERTYHEIPVVTREGRQLWIGQHVRLMRRADGTVVFHAVARDITDTRRFEAEREAREKAEDLLRLKTAFLNNMSHEIRTPLTGILGFAEILASEIDEPLKDFAHRIEKSGQRLLTTLNSVLDLAQLEGNSVTLHLEPLDLAEEIREIVFLLAPLAEEKGLTMEVVYPPDGVPDARLDRGCLHRILTNLVSNAIKFTPRGGVTISVSATADAVTVEVCDTGIGISPAFQPHLFDEFWQESTGQGRSHEGSGLGLAITKRLVELMQGRIAVESRQGEGTTFTVTFPCMPAGTKPAYAGA